MTSWLLIRGLRRAPRRALLAAVGVAFPVAILAATLFFVDTAARSMTRIALRPVQVEMRALATTLDANMTQVSRELATVPGVVRVERFAATNVVVSGPQGRATARLFAVDPEYLAHHPWVRPSGSGGLSGGALLNLQLGSAPGIVSSPRVSVTLPGRAEKLLDLPVHGAVDLREAFTWFEIPTGEVQGDIAMVPRAIVVDYASFERAVLPALRRELGTQTTVLNPGLSELPPVTVEAHITTSRAAYPGDPGRAAAFSGGLRRVLERRVAGAIVVADDTAEPLAAAATDADNAKILFLLLGIPGFLAAAALGLATESALAEAQRREEALLRLRGATDAQLVRLATAHAAVCALAGAVAGLLLAALAVSLVEGRALWHGTSAGRLAVSCLLAAGAGAGVTAVRVVRLRRAGRSTDLAAERRFVQAGWRPPWQRSRLDLWLIAAGGAILLVNALSGGLKPTPAEGSNVALSFYVLLAPVALWLGLTLLAVRLGLGALARRAAASSARPLGSWNAAVARWLGRRPARMAAALTLGVLAVAFGTEVVSFVGTYGAAKRADARAAFASDLHLRPTTDGTFVLPARLPGVASTTPIRYVPARAGTDRKTILTIDPASYARTTSMRPQMLDGHGLDALARDPRAVIVNKDVSQLLALRVGDTLPLTVFPDDQEKSRHKDLRVVGVYRSFPPSSPPSELVMSTSALPPFLLPQPDFHLARVEAGLSAAAVAARLRGAGLERAFKVSTEAEQAPFAEQSIAALDLGPLSDIESVGAGLIAALGVAVLGAFLVLERRREFAILNAVGADGRQLLASPAAEGAITVGGSLLIGIPLGLLLSILSVRVLGLFFVLPPPLVSVPGGTLLAFVAVMVSASAAVLAVSLRAVTRVATATTLREP